jgi:hypothetical protein
VSRSSGDPIPEDVRRFILEHIDSVPALEALLLMKRDVPRQWTAGAIAAELYMDPRKVTPFLGDLSSRGLCGNAPGAEPVYFWRPATPAVAENLERLAQVYAKHLVPVTNLIHAKPGPSVRGFSDAFRLRGSE